MPAVALRLVRFAAFWFACGLALFSICGLAQQTQSQSSSPWEIPGPAPGTVPALSVAPVTGEYSFDEAFFKDDDYLQTCGKECGGEVVFLYCDRDGNVCPGDSWHPLSVRVVSVRSSSSDDAHFDDWIAIADIKPYRFNTRRFHLIPLTDSTDRWVFPTADPKKVQTYLYRVVVKSGPDGAPLHWIQITAPNGMMVMDSNGQPHQFTIESLQRARVNQAKAINVKFSVRGKAYYIVPQSAPCRCNQLLDLRAESAKVVGVACVRRKTNNGSLELINGGFVELGFVFGPPDYYCVRPKRPAGSGWEAYMGDDCRPGIDRPACGVP